MKAETLEEQAIRHRLETKLRADLVRLGMSDDVVQRWPFERLYRERRRVLDRLMQTGGRRWDG